MNAARALHEPAVAGVSDALQAPLPLALTVVVTVLVPAGPVKVTMTVPRPRGLIVPEATWNALPTVVPEHAIETDDDFGRDGACDVRFSADIDEERAVLPPTDNWLDLNCPAT